MKICKNCHWWRMSKYVTSHGDCHRHPPAPQGAGYPGDDQVAALDYCAEWKVSELARELAREAIEPFIRYLERKTDWVEPVGLLDDYFSKTDLETCQGPGRAMSEFECPNPTGCTVKDYGRAGACLACEALYPQLQEAREQNALLQSIRVAEEALSHIASYAPLEELKDPHGKGSGISFDGLGAAYENVISVAKGALRKARRGVER